MAADSPNDRLERPVNGPEPSILPPRRRLRKTCVLWECEDGNMHDAWSEQIAFTRTRAQRFELYKRRREGAIWRRDEENGGGADEIAEPKEFYIALRGLFEGEGLAHDDVSSTDVLDGVRSVSPKFAARLQRFLELLVPHAARVEETDVTELDELIDELLPGGGENERSAGHKKEGASRKRPRRTKSAKDGEGSPKGSKRKGGLYTGNLSEIADKFTVRSGVIFRKEPPPTPK